MASVARGRSGGGGVRFRRTGGERLKRYITQQSDPALIARRATRVIRRRVLPAIRASVPKVSGALAASLKVRQRGRRIELRGNHYAPVARFKTARPNTTAGQARSALTRSRRVIGRAILRP